MVNERFVGRAHPARPGSNAETSPTVRLPVGTRGVPKRAVPRQAPPVNERPGQHRGEPVWCTVDHTTDGPRHRSNPVEVGRRQGGGTVRAWLVQGPGDREPHVKLNAAHMAGVVVDINLDDTQALRAGLEKLLWRAGRD